MDTFRDVHGHRRVWRIASIALALSLSMGLMIGTLPAYATISSDWPAFADGGQSGGAITTAATPTGYQGVAWAHRFDAGGSLLYPGDPIIVGDHVYVASGDRLEVIDEVTGTVEQTMALADSIGYYARLAYMDGYLAVPLQGGNLQVFAVSDTGVIAAYRTTVTPGVGQQALSTLTTYRDGLGGAWVVYGTTAVGGSANTGYLCGVNLSGESPDWQLANATAGYYWCGAAIVGSHAVISDDEGDVFSFDPTTGTRVFNLGSPIGATRSTTIADDGSVYVTSMNGTLHKFTMTSDGSLASVGSVPFATYSTSTPAIADGRAYVGGSTSTYKGLLAIIDVNAMTVERSIDKLANGSALPAESKSAPLVSTQDAGTFAYFTCNAKPGAVYAYRLGDGTASVVYAPGAFLQQYCTSSIICDAAGSLYYVNDSRTLFKLGAAPAKGTTFTSGKLTYKITSARTDGTGTVALIKASSYITSAYVGTTLSYRYVDYRVTSIGAKAFYGKTRLKTLNIASTQLAKIGVGAFYGCTHLAKLTLRTSKLTAGGVGAKAFTKLCRSATIDVPNSKARYYRKIFINRGLPKSVEVR